MCRNQLVQRNDFASFSVLGMAIILCTGLMIIVLHLLLDTTWARLRNRTELDKHKNTKWDEMELMEMQRTSSKIVGQAADDSEKDVDVGSPAQGTKTPVIGSTRSPGVVPPVRVTRELRRSGLAMGRLRSSLAPSRTRPLWEDRLA